MLLNMVMFKVIICDFGKMNINMTDKIEKRRLPLQCRTMARTTTTMWTARWCSILSMFLSVGFVEECNKVIEEKDSKNNNTKDNK